MITEQEEHQIFESIRQLKQLVEMLVETVDVTANTVKTLRSMIDKHDVEIAELKARIDDLCATTGDTWKEGNSRG